MRSSPLPKFSGFAIVCANVPEVCRTSWQPGTTNDEIFVNDPGEVIVASILCSHFIFYFSWVENIPVVFDIDDKIPLHAGSKRFPHFHGFIILLQYDFA
jgi:hypothetical protein